MGELMSQQSEYQIEMDPLAVGLTQPATKLGVPFIPFFMSVIAVFFGWLFYQSITGNAGITSMVAFSAIWMAAYLYMYQVTSRDVFGLNIAWVNLTSFTNNQTHEVWGHMDTYKS